MTPTIDAPKPPSHLRKDTQRWWADTSADWTLEPHHLRLLTLAAESWDRHEAARELIESEGLCVETKAGGPRTHPAVKIEAEARIAFVRCLRELDLDVDPPKEIARRPPVLRSIATR